MKQPVNSLLSLPLQAPGPGAPREPLLDHFSKYYVRLCFYVICACLPALPGGRRHAHPGIKSRPGGGGARTCMVHTRQSLTGPTHLQQPAPPSPLRHVARRLSHTQFWSFKAILSEWLSAKNKEDARCAVEGWCGGGRGCGWSRGRGWARSVEARVDVPPLERC